MSEYVTRDGGHRYPVDTPIWQCPETGAPVNLTEGEGLSRGDIETSERSLWRYAKAIRVDKTARVPLGEGCTPLIPMALDGGNVRLKLESLMPSGSFKDRGMAVLVAYLKAHGITEVMLDSSGNAAGSLACYAGASGITCTVLVPVSTREPRKSKRPSSSLPSLPSSPGTCRRAVIWEASPSLPS